MLEALIDQLRNEAELSIEQIREAADALVSPSISASLKADFLLALAEKGETPTEIAAFAETLRDRAAPVPLSAEEAAGCLDVVGAGGDKLGLVNLSTAAALIAAAADLPVAKHGNRAITSKAGSADALEALGIPIDLSPEAAAEAIRRNGFAFLFAPRYHPAFRHAAEARRLCAERGRRTIFNFLGPLLNPARPGRMLVGVPDPALCRPIAEALRRLGARRVLVVCGLVRGPGRQPPRPMDELSTLGDTFYAEAFEEDEIREGRLLLDTLPVRPAALENLRGGDAAQNARLLQEVLSGADRGPLRDAVLLNAAAALCVAGAAGSILEGWEQAALLIDSGRAAEKLAELAAAR